jgi:hypothetical protein
MANQVAARITNLKEQYRNPDPTKWGTVTADIVHQDGTVENGVKIGVPTSMVEWTAAVGQVVYLVENENQKWSKYRCQGAKTTNGMVGKDFSAPAGGGGNSRGGGGGYNRRSNTRDDYWTKKGEYEMDTRDPAIEFQSYVGMLTPFYLERGKAMGLFEGNDESGMNLMINRMMVHAKNLQNTYGQRGTGAPAMPAVNAVQAQAELPPNPPTVAEAPQQAPAVTPNNDLPF